MCGDFFFLGHDYLAKRILRQYRYFLSFSFVISMSVDYLKAEIIFKLFKNVYSS
jgi:hypothetical protein